MVRLILFLVGVVALAAGLSWLADRPGSLVVNWQGYEIETSVFRAVVLFAFLLGLAMFAWSIVRQIWASPATVGRYFTRRRQERGLDALSSGMIAIGAGDRALATRYAVQARKALPNEPLTHLLRAQAAQLSGDRTTSRRIFEAMLGSPDTEQLGLRGLFLEAEREGEREAARQFAERALQLNQKLSWPVDALFELQCRAQDWAGALDTLAVARKNGHAEKPDADRRRAVLLTAQAQALEEENGQKALDLALEAHNLAPDLVPAATIAGRQLASRGSTPKAAKVIERTWKLSPHPDLAMVYAYARPGDSPRDRLDRIKRLARSTPHSVEGPIAIATAAVDARNWAEARHALAPLVDGRLTPRVCTLMARIEGGDRNSAGGVREWLARAVNAPRDPAWTADGVVSDTWGPISPVTGALDAYQWKVPVEASTAGSTAALEKLEELVMLGGAPEPIAREDAQDISLDPDEPVAAPSVVAAPPVARPPVVAAPVAAPASTGAASPAPTTRSEATVDVSVAPASQAKTASVPAVARSAAVDATGTAKPREHGGNGHASERAGDKLAPRVATVSVERSRPAAAAEKPALFVPPRAPDDPGPDATDDDATPRPDVPLKAVKR